MSRFSWATVTLALTVATGAWLAGLLLDAGPAATLAGVCAVFLTVGATGGSLRADLRLLVVVGPLFVVAMTLPRLLTPVGTVGALASLSALVLVAGLLAGRGPRWATVGKGLALTALMSYGLPLGESVTAGQLLAGAVAALAAVVVLRLALGARDPSGPVRAKVADVLLTPQPDVAGALVAWLQDRPTAWLGEALVAAGASGRSAPPRSPTTSAGLVSRPAPARWPRCSRRASRRPLPPARDRRARPHGTPPWPLSIGRPMRPEPGARPWCRCRPARGVG